MNGTATQSTSNADVKSSLYENLDNMFVNQVGMDGLVGLGVVLLENISSQGKGTVAAILETLGVGSMALLLLRTMVTLGIAMAGISFFLLFTPMFLSFFLFQTTKRLFDSWLALLISFTLQPFIIFAFLGMMAIVTTKAAPDGLADMKDIMEDMMKIMIVKPFEPGMMEGAASVNVTTLDRNEMIRIFPTLKPPIPVNNLCPDPQPDPPVKNCVEAQDQFLTFFVPKVLFWFMMNMIMASFIKEVPGLAQRLSGFISAPALGATTDSMFGGRSRGGIELPGISRGSGGETVSLLRDSLGKNLAIRRMVTGGIALGTAGALNEALDGQGRTRDRSDIANKASVGQANREGPQTSRAGTLGELLGSRTANREGPQAGGINSPLEAGRDGAKVTNVAGVQDGAARTETINDNFRQMQQKAALEAQNTANQNAKRGAELLSGVIPGIKITGPDMSEKPTVRRNLGLNDVELMKANANGATYTVDGKKVTLKKAEEEKFLMQKIAEINKDMTKTKVMGARGAEELKYSMQQRVILENRLRAVLSEKRVMESAQQHIDRLKLQGAVSKEAEQVIKIVPRLVQQGNVAGIGKVIEKLQASKDVKRLTPLILDLQELQRTLSPKSIVRQETVRESGQKAEQKLPPLVGEQKQNVAKLELKAHEAIVKIKQNSEKQTVTQEMNKVEGQIHNLVRNRDIVGITNMIAELRASPNAADYEPLIRDLRILNQGMGEVPRAQIVRQPISTEIIRQQEKLLAELDKKGVDIFDQPKREEKPVVEEKPEDKARAAEFDKAMNEAMEKAGVPTTEIKDGNANIFKDATGGQAIPGGKKTVTQKVKTPNPNYIPGDPESGPEFLEENKEIITDI